MKGFKKLAPFVLFMLISSSVLPNTGDDYQFIPDQGILFTNLSNSFQESEINAMNKQLSVLSNRLEKPIYVVTYKNTGDFLDNEISSEDLLVKHGLFRNDIILMVISLEGKKSCTPVGQKLREHIFSDVVKNINQQL